MGVSIIVPTYNNEKYIEQCIQSIIKQTYEEIEIIIVLDGPIDNTENIVRYIGQNDQRIKIINQSNMGSGPARNNGLRHAKYEYIMFVDGDDWIEPRMVESLIDDIERYNVDIVFCESDSVYCDKNGKTLYSIKATNHSTKLVYGKENVRNDYYQLYFDCYVTGPVCTLYKKSIIVTYNVRFPDLSRSQDIIFNSRYFHYVNSYYIDSRSFYSYRHVGTDNNFSLKISDDYYKILIILYDDLISNLKKWNVRLDNERKKYISDYFSIKIGYCIESILVRKPKDYKQTVESIINNNDIQDIVKYALGNNLYQKLLNRALQQKNYNNVVMMVKFKNIIRSKLSKLYIYLRDRIGSSKK